MCVSISNAKDQKQKSSQMGKHSTFLVLYLQKEPRWLKWETALTQQMLVFLRMFDLLERCMKQVSLQKNANPSQIFYSFSSYPFSSFKSLYMSSLLGTFT